jgi:molybdopterin-guanine dinucleotide biosynthesis protein MobB
MATARQSVGAGRVCWKEKEMPPVICIVGHSNSGKTTLVEKLLPELISRGYRVATAKHAQDIDLDHPGTDSWRHVAAGSTAMVLATNDRVVLAKAVPGSPKLDEVIRLIGEECDLVLAEGFKGEPAPKIEVQRNQTGPLLTGLKGLFAVVSDESIDTKARKFAWSDIKGLVDLIEEGFIKPNLEHVSVYVNGAPIVLSSFPREIVKNLMVAVAASLKGAGEPASIEFKLRKGG